MPASQGLPIDSPAGNYHVVQGGQGTTRLGHKQGQGHEHDRDVVSANGSLDTPLRSVRS